jgi:polyisoprenoid-binding protein YceI
MKSIRKGSFIALVTLASAVLFIVATGFDGTKQTLKTLPTSSKMTIKGTSSLHDWTVDVGDFQCDMTMISDLSLMKIESVAYTGKAKSIKSDNSTMDKKILEALKADKFPNIRFTVRSSRDVTMTDKKFSGLITGDITIAGKTKSETIHFTGEMISANRMRINGTKKLKMTDFGISPPTAMLGALKTGDEVSVTFSLVMAVSQ